MCEQGRRKITGKIVERMENRTERGDQFNIYSNEVKSFEVK